MKIVYHYDASPEVLRRFEALAADGLHVTACSESDDALFAGLMTGAEVLWHMLKPVTAAVIAAAPNLRFIQKIGVGVNTIDLDAARARGIRVANMPGTNSRAVAEMSLALMLAALRRLPAFDAAMRRGTGWSWPPEIQDQAGEIAGRTVGLVGYGAVPRYLAPALKAMCAEVLYWATAPKDDAVAQWRDLPDLLAQSDVVSLHLPLTTETDRLLDARAIARMKPGAVLVNTARGGLVDEPALVKALTEGRLRAAGLDVFAVEPVEPGNPLLALDNVVLAPHVAWLSQETIRRSLAVAVDNTRRLARGEALLHQVV
jgi:phosphoglycerate dehydrogenase-like enzyme